MRARHNLSEQIPNIPDLERIDNPHAINLLFVLDGPGTGLAIQHFRIRKGAVLHYRVTSVTPSV